MVTKKRRNEGLKCFREFVWEIKFSFSFSKFTKKTYGGNENMAGKKI